MAVVLDVATFGEVLWDFFEARRRGSEPIARLFRRELGGAPANVATGLARLGVRAAVIGGVGRDRFGQALIEQLRADGVFTRFVVPLPERTGLTFVIRDAHGEPEFIFYRHETADLSIRAEHLKPAMGRASWALVGTSTWMTRELSRATSRFLDLAERAGAFVMVDLNVRPHLWSDPRAMRSAIAKLIERAVLVKASDADLRALHGGTDDARWLRGLETGRGRTSWLVTRGPGLASAIGDHGETHLPAYRARCVDATGAGDAFIAGSLATLLAARATPGSPSWGDPEVWLAALRAGHMMGKKAISRPGAVAGLHALGRVRAVVDSVRRSGR